MILNLSHKCQASIYFHECNVLHLPLPPCTSLKEKKKKIYSVAGLEIKILKIQNSTNCSCWRRRPSETWAYWKVVDDVSARVRAHAALLRVCPWPETSKARLRGSGAPERRVVAKVTDSSACVLRALGLQFSACVVLAASSPSPFP